MKTPARHPNVINLKEADENAFGQGQFGTKVRRLAFPSGGKELGCNWYEVAPGKTAFPFHYHAGIEEALFILKGRGSLRIGESRVEVTEGDYISFPAGPETAHALKNTGAEPLQYLAISNQNQCDIVGYPDSKKFQFSATPHPEKGPWVSPWVHKMVRDEPSVNYFEGEPEAQG